MSRIAKGKLNNPVPSTGDRVVVYLPRQQLNALRIKLIEKTGSGNVSNWVREQLTEFLKRSS